MVSGYVVEEEEEERRRENTNRQPLYTAAAVLRVTICKLHILPPTRERLNRSKLYG